MKLMFRDFCTYARNTEWVETIISVWCSGAYLIKIDISFSQNCQQAHLNITARKKEELKWEGLYHFQDWTSSRKWVRNSVNDQIPVHVYDDLEKKCKERAIQLIDSNLLMVNDANQNHHKGFSAV
jgi:hypothetical protein